MKTKIFIGGFLCSFLFVLTLCRYVQADTVYLKNGGRINGAVIKDNGNIVVIDIGAGTVTHNSRDIARIEPDAPRPALKSPAVKTNFTKIDIGSNKRIRAPAPKSKISGVIDGMADIISSVLRLDFLKRSTE